MLIISKFHDYYDSSIGYGGIDKTIIYKREQNIIEYPKSRRGGKDDKYTKLYNQYFKFFDDNDLIFDDREFIDRQYRYYKIVLLICGKIYCCIQLTHKEKNIFLYDYDEVINSIKNEFGEKVYQNFINYKSYYSYSKHPDIKAFFDIPNTLNISELKIIEYHRLLNSPIIQYWSPFSPQIIINPKLKDIQFYKKIDAFQMFQNIEMFISGVMGSGKKEIIEVDDIAKRDKHGFDYKSFKNM